jgi:hypothetical protein
VDHTAKKITTSERPHMLPYSLACSAQLGRFVGRRRPTRWTAHQAEMIRIRTSVEFMVLVVFLRGVLGCIYGAYISITINVYIGGNRRDRRRMVGDGSVSRLLDRHGTSELCQL